MVEWHGLPFHHLPIETGRKEQQEGRLLALFRELEADLLVLARYMQILSERACEQAVERVDHAMSVEQLTTLGNEIESVVLNRAIQWHAEHRIFQFGSRTVVLR